MKMPVLFLGHGSPMNALMDNHFTRFLSKLGPSLPRPRAILMVSAHWETEGTKILKTESPKTIHDFGGFPRELFEIQYPVKGDLALADQIEKMLLPHKAVTDSSWGLDHGTWALLKFIYPKADVPVLQLSLNKKLSFAEHLKLARDLKPLRDDGVLIIGSGNITHNLRQVVWDEKAKPLDWAVEFDTIIKTALENRDEKTLTHLDSDHDALWRTAQPHPDHYIPLLYVYGVSDESEKVKFVYDGMELGSLSMRSFQYG